MSMKSLVESVAATIVSSTTTSSSSSSSTSSSDVIRQGYLRKLKTLRKKYFVLRSDSGFESPARLEYYDSEKKFTSGAPPKRSIPLKNCFNINRRLDLKHKYVIALYTKDDCFCVVVDNDEEVESWLKALLNLQHGEEAVDGETPKPTFEHVWQVTVLNRGLGTLGLTGNWRLCLTDKTLSLIKRDCENPQIELNLTNIRSCGNLKAYFFLEIGRSSTLGAGELWMETEDHNIAHNVHSTVFHAMSANSNKDELGPKSRNRSSSATESSKSSMGRKSVGPTVAKPNFLAQDAPICPTTTTTTTTTTAATTSNDTPPQLPSSQNQHAIVSGVASFYQHLFHRATPKASRRHSISVGGGVTWSGNICHQRTQSLPLANPAPISDQNTISQPSRATTKRSNQSSKCVGGGGGGAGGRERCDSMPSRARTTSEGNHVTSWNHQRYHLNPYRPASLYGRDMSHSPPSGSPVSPPSVGCSTDSAGSSYSLADETDVCTEHETILGRYGHSLTPDEAIAEEDCLDCPGGGGRIYAVGGGGLYLPMDAIGTTDDGYVDMSPRGRNHNNSPTASLSSVTSGTPSTDMRFAEYPLEKVTSYFPPSEDDDSRPARAYSVGSRPETYRYKKCMELASSSIDARVRAFSVGSKTKKIYNKVLPPHGHHVTHQGGKSSSAPILNTSRHGQGSHSSIGPMDDLMEMDFSRSGTEVNSGYMEMNPVPKVNSHGYVEMRPGTTPEMTSCRGNGRVPDTSPYVDMTSGSSPARQNGDYMDMDPRKNSLNNNNHVDYCDMDLAWAKNRAGNSQTSNYHVTPVNQSMIIDYRSDGGLKAVANNTNDGYVKMNLRQGQRVDSAEIAYENGDYTNMSVGKAKKRERGEKTTRSQPIAIQNVPSLQKQTPITSAGSSASPPFPFGIWGRKFSTGTPPKMNLPLGGGGGGSSGSLPGRKSKRNSRRSSKDSSSSSVTTPSSSSTIFPISLNSPCSPVKPAETPLPPTTTTTTIKVPSSVLNTVYKKSSNKNSDYVMMEGDRKLGEDSSDYVNFCPADGQSPLTNRVASIGLMEDTSFRPINENRDESCDSVSDNTNAYEILRSRPANNSRPSSTSSELCSSSSTIVGSRPESVNSDRIRPPSVSSGDVLLHYASLDLDEGVSGGGIGGGNRSPRTVRGDLTYADIDFAKSENLKQQNKVKH